MVNLKSNSARSTTNAKVPPGPKGYPVLGNLPQLAGNTLEFLKQCSEQYGDAVTIKSPTGPIYFLNNPEYIEEVLVTNNRNFVKPKMYQIVRPVVGNGLGISDGDYWLRQRRLVQPAFHRQTIASYAQTMVACTEEHLADWQPGDKRDIHNEMLQLTLKIVSKIFFNAEWSTDAKLANRAFEIAFEEIGKRFKSIVQLPLNIPTPGNLRFQRALSQLNEIIYKLIEERRRAHIQPQPSEQNWEDILSMLLKAQDEHGESMTDQQLRDEMMALLLAGHETTAAALTWAWHLLSSNPQVQKELKQELLTVVGNRSVTFDDLPKLTYTEMVVKEVLRLYPPLWFFGREAVKDCTVSGYKVAAGTQVWFSPWILQRDARYYVQPEQFLPRRWDSSLSATSSCSFFNDNLPRYAYFPFGGGPKQCIGNTFALMNIRLVLATICQRLTFNPLSEQTPEQELFPTLRPKNGLEMLLQEA